MVGFVVLVLAMAWVVELLVGYGAAGLVVALVVVGIATFVGWWKSDAIALKMSHARPADPEQYARLHNLVEGLCIAAGLPKPGCTSSTTPRPTPSPRGATPATRRWR